MTADTDRSKSILRALMDPSAPDSVPWSSNELCDILEHQLATTLSAETEGLAAMAELTPAQVTAMIANHGDQTFKQLLTHPAPPAELLRLVKDFAKASISQDNGLPGEVARVLYVLTILRGRATGAKISSLNAYNIDRQTWRCLALGWLSESIRTMLREAIKR